MEDTRVIFPSLKLKEGFFNGRLLFVPQSQLIAVRTDKLLA